MSRAKLCSNSFNVSMLKSLLKISVVILLIVLAMNISQIPKTTSTLADKEKFPENSFSAGTWGEDELSFQAEDLLTLEQKVVEEEKILGDIEDSGTEIIAPEIEMTIKTFDITLMGELNVPEGYIAEIFQIVKSIKLIGETGALETFTDPEINLADIKIEKEGKIDILVSDLKINEDLTLASAKGDDMVLAIIVSENPKEEIFAEATSQ